MRKIVLFAIALCFSLLISGCTTVSKDHFDPTKTHTKDKGDISDNEIQKLLADHNGVTISDIRVRDYSYKNGEYVVRYQLQKNGVWEPENDGFYMSKITKGTDGKYKVTTIHF